ncbi:MAG: molybdenum cofactor guanylyltransferase [Chloroflexi bacterium]|nr:molybdenum cofactor guanylyltransferase [Chloroflexota bacterium]
MQIAAIILAGGKNRRLGRRKALEPILGKTLIERVVERLKPLTSQVIVVTSPELLDLPVARQADIVIDIYPGKGPLGGVYTGLLASGSSHSVVIACDMPFVSTALLSYMVRLSHDFDAVIPRLGEGRLEPLHAVYSRDCLTPIKSQLEHGKLEAYSFLNAVRVRYVDCAECQRFDPELLSFFNINCQSDLERAIVLATRHDRVLKAANDAAGVLEG